MTQSAPVVAAGNGDATKRTAIAPATAAHDLPAVHASFTNLAGFELAQRVATALAKSTLVPEQYRNNMPNCMIALEMAERLGASILMVMQNLYVVHGRPGWSAKFLIASFNQCGRFSAIRYEWIGERGKDTWGCRAWATESKTGHRIEGPTITIELAKKEGWYSKNGSKWQTIPELMLMYRSAGWLVNTHAPEISMGLNSTEELEDIELKPDSTGAYGLDEQVATATEQRQRELREKLGGDDTAETGEVADDEEQAAVDVLVDAINLMQDGLGFKSLETCTGTTDVTTLTKKQAAEAIAYLTALRDRMQAQAKKPAPDAATARKDDSEV